MQYTHSTIAAGLSRAFWLAHVVAVLSAADCVATAAQRFDSLYGDSTLVRWRPVYSENVRWNLENVVLRVLTPDEREGAGRVRIRFPLRAGSPDPVGHSSDTSGVISISVLSLRFLHDLAVAHAWLADNRYSTSSVTDYLTALKYRSPAEFPEGRYLPPLPALGVPAIARGRASVSEASDRTLKGALVFVLAHEVGHLRDRGRATAGHGQVDPRAREAAADSFALSVFRRLGVAPFGLSLLFRASVLLASHRGDFESDSLWLEHYQRETNHLISRARLDGLAHMLLDDPTAFAQREPRFRVGVQAVRDVADELLEISGRIDESGARRSLMMGGREIALPPFELRPVGTP